MVDLPRQVTVILGGAAPGAEGGGPARGGQDLGENGSSAGDKVRRDEGARRAARGSKRSKGKGGGVRPRGGAGTEEEVQTAQQAVGKFLRAARSAQSLTQAEVASMTRESPWRLSRAAISAIERGQNFPGLEAMLALSNVLYVDPKELIERARLSSVVPVDITGITYEELEQKALRHFWAGEFRQAISVYDAMAEKLALEPAEDREERAKRIAQLEVSRSTALRRAGALHAALATAERAVSLAHEYPAIQARAYIALATTQCERGHLPLARDATQRAIDLAQNGGARLQGWAWMSRAQVHFVSGRSEDSREAYLEARRCAEVAGDHDHLTHIEGSIGICHHVQGDLETAREWIGRAIESARSRDQFALEARWLVELGRVEFTAGALDLAEEHARAALRVAEPREQTLTIFRAEWLRHLVQRRTDPSDADTARLDLLRQLFLQLDQHQGIEEIREFRNAVMGMPDPGSGDEP